MMYDGILTGLGIAIAIIAFVPFVIGAALGAWLF